MEALAKDLYDRALQNRENRTWSATTMDEVKKIVSEKTGFVKTMWCGDLACEEAMKTEAGLSSRCMPFEQEHLSDVCPVCGKPAKSMVVWGHRILSQSRQCCFMWHCRFLYGERG